MESSKKVYFRVMQAALWLVFAAYAFVLVKIILLKYGWGAELRSVNFVPFRFVGDLLHPMTSLGVVLKNVLGNIAIFMPLGLLAPALWSRIDRWGKAVLVGLALSAAFELLQMIFGLGATDVDDLLLNTLGAAAGAGVYFGLFRRLSGEWKPRLATLLFLVVFGLLGLLALWMFAPGELPPVVKYENAEVLNGLDPASCNVSATVTGLDEGWIACLEWGAQTTEDGEALPWVETEYSLTADVTVYLMEITYQFSPNGNIQKTFCRYSASDLAAAKAVLEQNDRLFADLWLDGNGACNTILLTVYPE